MNTSTHSLGGYRYVLDFKRDNNPTLVNPSWWSILMSALRYVKKQFFLEKRNACIGTTIIMFIVCMASFIFVFFQNASQLYFFLSQESIGDIDILVSPNPHVVSQKHSLYSNRKLNGTSGQSHFGEHYERQMPGLFED